MKGYGPNKGKASIKNIFKKRKKRKDKSKEKLKRKTTEYTKMKMKRTHIKKANEH
jgi:Skp family chaperone for outer membrane proteins